MINPANEQPRSLESIFNARRVNFLDTLHKILASCGSDRFVKQMFDDKASAMYIPDRICELVRIHLNDEREAYIETLQMQLRSLEACVGPSRLKKLEAIGDKFLSVSNSQVQKENEHRKCIALLKEQLNDLQNDLSGKNNSLGELKDDLGEMNQCVQSLQKEINTLRSVVNGTHSDMVRTIRGVKSQSKKAFLIMRTQLNHSKDMQANFEHRLSQLQQKYKNVDIPKLKHDFEQQVFDFQHEIDLLNSELTKSKKENVNLKKSNNKALQEIENLKRTMNESLQSQKNEYETKIVNMQNKLKNKYTDEINDALQKQKADSEQQLTLLQNKLNIKHSNEMDELLRKQRLETEQKISGIQNKLHLEHINDLNDVRNQMQKSKEAEIAALLTKHQLQYDEMKRQLSMTQSNTESSNKELCQNLDQLSRENASLIAQLNQKQQEIEKLNNLLSKHKLEKDQISRSKSMVEADAQMLQSKVSILSQLEKEKNEAIERARSLETINFEQNSRMKELQIAVQGAQKQIQQMKLDFMTTMENSNDKSKLLIEINKLRDQISSFHHALEDRDKKISDLNNEIEKLSAVISKKKFTIEQMKSTLMNSQKAVSDAQRKMESMNEKVNEYKSSIQSLNNQYQQKTKQNQDLVRAQKDLEASNRELRTKLEQSEESSQQLSETLALLSDEFQQTQSLIKMREEQLQSYSTADRALDFNEAQRTINTHITALNNSEERNKSLIAKYESLENQIKQLTNENLKKDREIKNLQQNEITQSKQIDRFQSLIQQQQQEIDDAHATIIQLHERILSIQSEAENQNDSMKSLSLDHDRATEERKQIETLSIEDRTRYRNEINRLQSEVGKLSVEKNELDHKLDEAQFDLKSINQMIEEKAKELQNEKDHNLKDIESARSINSKLMEELSQARDKQTEQDKVNKQIIRDISKMTPIDSLQDVVGLLEKTNQQAAARESILSNLCDALALDEETSLLEKIEEMKAQNNQLKNQEEQLKTLLSSESKDLPTDFAAMKRQLIELQQLKVQLSRALNTDDIIPTVSQIKYQNDNFIERENVFKETVQDYSFEGLPVIFSSLAKENAEMKAREAEMMSILKTDIPNSMPKAIAEMQSSLAELNQLDKQLKQTIPAQTSEIPKIVNRLQEMNQELIHQQNSLKGVFPGNVNGSLVDHITQILKQNVELKREKKATQNEIPTNLRSNEIPEAIAILVQENKNLHHTQDEIKELFSGEVDQDIVSEIASILKENEQLKEKVSKLESLLSSGDIFQQIDSMIKDSQEYAKAKELLSTDDVIGAIEELLKEQYELESIQQALGTKDAIPQIKKLQKAENELEKIKSRIGDYDIDELIENSKALKKCLEIHSCENKEELISLLNQYKYNLDSAADLFTKLLGVLLGPTRSPVKVRFPVTTQVRDRLINLIAEHKQRIDSQDKLIEQVMGRAKGAGYLENDLIEGVIFLETAAMNLQKQEDDEVLHKEINALRQILEKQQALAEKQKEKHKRRIENQRQMISELQEKNSNQEEALYRNIEEEQKKNRQLTYEMEKEKRIRGELIRLAGGQISDLEYLKSVLDKKEIATIMATEKMRLLMKQMIQKDEEAVRLQQMQRQNRQNTIADVVSIQKT